MMTYVLHVLKWSSVKISVLSLTGVTPRTKGIDLARGGSITNDPTSPSSVSTKKDLVLYILKFGFETSL